MRTIPIAVAAIALFGGAALAQTTHNSLSPSPPPSSGSAAKPGSGTTAAPKPAVNPLTQEDVAKIEGSAVYGSDDAKIGHVETVLMDPSSKKIEKFVIASGGLWGIGSHRVALPMDQFTWDSAKAGFKIGQTEAKLKAMPEWVEGHSTATGSSTPPSKATAPAPNAGDSKPASK